MEKTASTLQCGSCGWEGEMGPAWDDHKHMCTGTPGWVREIGYQRDCMIVENRLRSYEAACKLQAVFRGHIAKACAGLLGWARAGD